MFSIWNHIQGDFDFDPSDVKTKHYVVNHVGLWKSLSDKGLSSNTRSLAVMRWSASQTSLQM